jgi:hypothetical protein
MTAILEFILAVLSSRWFWAGLAVGGLVWLVYGAGQDDIRDEWRKVDLVAAADAARLQRDHTQALRLRDMQITAFRDELEKQHAQREEEVRRMAADNRRLARELGGLRDPGRRASGGDGVSAAAEPAAGGGGAACSDRLSAEASEFLLDLAEQADRVVGQYETCRAWALRVPDAASINPGKGDAP